MDRLTKRTGELTPQQKKMVAHCFKTGICCDFAIKACTCGDKCNYKHEVPVGINIFKFTNHSSLKDMPKGIAPSTLSQQWFLDTGTGIDVTGTSTAGKSRPHDGGICKTAGGTILADTVVDSRIQ